MSTLDRAFISAFAKRRPGPETAQPAGTARPAAAPRRRNMLHSTSRSLQTPHTLWRVDFPREASEANVSWVPEPHATFPPVQHVETYDLETIEQAVLASVQLDERITLAKLLDELTDRSTNWHGGTMNACPLEEIGWEGSRRLPDHSADPAPSDDSSDEPRRVAPADPDRWDVGLAVAAAGRRLAILMSTDYVPAAAEDAAGVAAGSVCTAIARCGPEHAVPHGVVRLETDPDNVQLTRDLQAAMLAAEVRMPDPTCIPDLDTRPDGEPIQPECEPFPSEPPVDSPEVNRLVEPIGMPATDRHALKNDLPAAVLLPIDRDKPARPEPGSAMPPPLPESADLRVHVAPPPLDEPAPSAPADAPELPAPAAAAPAAPTFVAAWEVDAFRWPALCQQLEETAGVTLGESGQELALATQDGLKTLAVTSAQRREGRTTVALCLARAAAQAGARVALLDADLGNPALARQLGVETPTSWLDVCRRQEPLAEAAVHSVRDGVTLFPLITPLEATSNLWRDELFWTTMARLADEFDLVLVDMPPVGEQAAEPVAGRENCAIDVGLVVRNVHATSEQESVATVQLLKQIGIGAVGIAENFVAR